MLARVNSFREEPGGSGPRLRPRSQRPALHPRQEVEDAHDLSRISTGATARPGIFRKLAWEVGFANGLSRSSSIPTTCRTAASIPCTSKIRRSRRRRFPTTRTSRASTSTGYTVTAPIATPGPITREGVLIEWTDTNRSNATFEGTARELLRLQLNTRIHPLGDLRVQSRRAPRRQRLAGAVHRQRRRRLGRVVASRHAQQSAAPRHAGRQDPAHRARASADHQSTSTVSDNGRYRIPNDNPFVAMRGARKEIWAVGIPQSASPALGDRSGQSARTTG